MNLQVPPLLFILYDEEDGHHKGVEDGRSGHYHTGPESAYSYGSSPLTAAITTITVGSLAYSVRCVSVVSIEVFHNVISSVI